MIEINTRTINLEGNNYDIGFKIGSSLKNFPIKEIFLDNQIFLEKESIEKVKNLINKYSYGIVDEIKGFADGMGVDEDRVLFYAMSYLKPGCSQIAFSNSITNNGHTILARNYEFNHSLEDFNLIKTKVEGKYCHLGTSVLFFGRDDGINEEGLAISMSSCGIPVGAVKEMKQAKVEGLQFWLAIRGVLENCKNVDEGIDFLNNFPIGSNVNFILADRYGKLALFNIIDGDVDTKIIEKDSSDKILHITNHFNEDKMKKYNEIPMENSVKRYSLIENFIKDRENISVDEIKTFLLKKFPEGLYLNYYEDFFGTTKSIIMDCDEKSLEIVWGGRKENIWRKYNISETLMDSEIKIYLDNERMK